MRRLPFALLLCLTLTALVAGAPAQSFEQITVADTAIGITAATIDPPGAPQMTLCVGRLETAEIRYRTDGGTPTTTVGTPLEPLELLTLDTHAKASNLKMIRTTSTSALITFECSDGR